MAANHFALHIGFRCRPCGKWCYKDRKTARNAARRLYPDEALRAYKCVYGWWHIGHTPDDVKRGEREPFAAAATSNPHNEEARERQSSAA